MLANLGASLLALAWLIPNHYTPWLAAWGDASALAGCMVLALWAGTRAAHGLRVSRLLSIDRKSVV